MYEQDYIIRMNNEVIRTMVKLLLNKDTGVPVNISEGTIKSENKKMLEDDRNDQDIDNICDPDRRDLIQKILEEFSDRSHRVILPLILIDSLNYTPSSPPAQAREGRKFWGSLAAGRREKIIP